MKTRLIPGISISLALIVGLTAANVASASPITNGDFEAGNTGFSSDYTFGSIQDGATVYNIVSNPASDHNQATSYGDHTTGTGLMMAVNGCCEPAVSPVPVVWSQSVNVDPNTDYLFSMFLSSWFAGNPAVLDVSTLEFGSIGSVTAPTSAGIWEGFQASFNSGSYSSLTLEITDTFVLTGGAGNDFALDDISLTRIAVPEPGTLALLGLGLAGMGFARRKKA